MIITGVNRNPLMCSQERQNPVYGGVWVWEWKRDRPENMVSSEALA